MSNKVPPPPGGDPPSWASNTLAKGEEEFWPQEDKLKGQKHTNQLWILKVVGWIVPTLMIIFTFIFAVALVSWSAHYFLPEKNWWLTDDQLSKIQSVIFSGALGAIVSGYAQRHISK
jgi:hypothetical protein